MSVYITPLTIGPYTLPNNLVLAPMAGVTDLPFRQLTRRLGAGLVVSEMVTSDMSLWHTRKSQQRMQHQGEPEPISVQIAGNDPQALALAAQHNVDLGAHIIDINMGCPAKKVCKKLAGSALLADEALVERILATVVQSVPVPVTLKIRTGSDRDNRNGLTIAKIAEQSGIQALSIHGRTRADKFNGDAEYDTIASIKQQLSIPIIANGDIDSPEKAKFVLDRTKVDGIMVGRAAQGNPWIFQNIQHYLATGKYQQMPAQIEVCETILEHVNCLYEFYGQTHGIKIARKHVGWYVQALPNGYSFKKQFNQLTEAEEQLTSIEAFFTRLDYTSSISASSISNNGELDKSLLAKKVKVLAA